MPTVPSLPNLGSDSPGLLQQEPQAKPSPAQLLMAAASLPQPIKRKPPKGK